MIINEELTILGSKYNISRLNRRARLILNVGKYPQSLGRHTHSPCDEDKVYRFKTFFVYRGTMEKALQLSPAKDPLLKGIGIIFPVGNKAQQSQLDQMKNKGWIVLDEECLYVITSNAKGLSVKDENHGKRYVVGQTNLQQRHLIKEVSPAPLPKDSEE